MSQASIVPLIDRSQSMSQSNYFKLAKADCSTFVNMLNPLDQLAVVAFSKSAKVIFPSSPSLVSATQTQVDAALKAIDSLSAKGQTNMAEAVSEGYSLLSGAANPAMVLLTDGFYNVGGKPVLQGTSVPIYTIALGDLSDKTYMESVATTTGGQYNFSPDGWTLAEIYNDIVNQSGIAFGVTGRAPQAPSKFTVYPATVESNASNQYFSVNWVDQAIQFTKNTPVGNQVNVSLKDPNGKRYDTPTAVGDGFVVFKVPSPAAGQWSIGVWTAKVGSAGQFKGTWGSFNPDSSISLMLTAKAPDEPGAPLHFHAVALDGGEPIPGVQMTAIVEAPTHTLEEVKARLKPELEKLESSEEMLADGIPEDTARLISLNAHQGGDSIIPRSAYPLLEGTPPDGVYRSQVTHTRVMGTYTVRLSAHGYSGKSKTNFERTRRVDIEL